MFTIFTMKWERQTKGHQLPAVCDYGSEHVNKMFNMLKRNLTLPFRFVCITDNITGLDPDIETIRLWDLFANLGGCYRRLFVFSPVMKKYLGDKFISIDLDAVITGNLDELFSLDDDFRINEYAIHKRCHATHQYYNGGLFMMKAGARAKVWHTFYKNPEKVINEIKKRNEGKARPELVGSDQAVIAHILGEGEKTFNDKMGVYDYSLLSRNGRGKFLPTDAKIVLFAGKRDPSTELNKSPWIAENWR